MASAPYLQFKEIELVKRVIILPILLKSLDQDLAVLQKNKLHMWLVYNAHLKSIGSAIKRELKELEKQMKQRGIKILSQQHESNGLFTQFLCRGYEHEISLLHGFIHAQITIILSEYLKIDLTEID
ncbi:hypothetical protein [Fredinandcohnia quinoae]|uniref:Uncharacterized protein n=1 Tax=Fredinandcohnia quinoae TaxID=2918902 RepID=A0AAW5E270_9BACI|nr:hypothetical protein [Fredinandcohnia sp. SECRCQ15]MCH1624859.1 hypothetical protein [Fredinandcohnia sp. SECRCQ15]